MESNLTIDCAVIKGVMPTFFQRCLDTRVTDRVLSHLLKCPVCSRAYSDYASRHNLTFNLEKEAKNFVYRLVQRKETKLYYKTYSILQATGIPFDIFNYEYFVDTYSLTNVAKDVVALRKIIGQGRDNDNNNSADSESALFQQYLAKKLCRKIDKLERELTLIYKPTKEGDGNARV